MGRHVNLLVVVLAVVFGGRIYADDLLESVLKCKQRRIAESPARGHVFLRAYPFQFEQVEIPIEGQGLLGVIVQKELIAQSIVSSRIKPVGRDRVKNRFLAGAIEGDESPTLVHIRGTEVTVFPRAMLVHPVVAGSMLKPQDIVLSMTCKQVSFSSASGPDVKLLNESDPIHKWFHSTFVSQVSAATSKKIAVEVSGDLVPPSLIGRQSLNPRTGFYKWLDRDLKLDIPIDKLKVGNSLVVACVKRQVGIWSLRFVVPLEKTGAFKYNSPYYAKLFAVADNPDKSWDRSLDNFRSLVLIDGDTVDVSYHRAIPLFQQQALLVPLN